MELQLECECGGKEEVTVFTVCSQDRWHYRCPLGAWFSTTEPRIQKRSTSQSPLDP